MAAWRHLRRTRQSRGAVAIEYALVLPVFLLFVFGIMDLSRLLWTYTTLHRAVEAAARCGAINTIACGSIGQIQSRAVSEAWGLTITPSAFTVSAPSCGVRVHADYTFVFIIPWLSVASPFGADNAIALQATACYAADAIGTG